MYGSEDEDMENEVENDDKFYDCHEGRKMDADGDNQMDDDDSRDARQDVLGFDWN